MSQDSLNTGCVWSVQSSEAEIWDVWKDIRCNDGLLLMDGIQDVFGASGHQKLRSGTCGQTFPVMMDFCGWTGSTGRWQVKLMQVGGATESATVTGQYVSQDSIT
ncbi:hypothetical protein R3I93_019610 [Phoxinus phoxinus]|uniref:Uncharacterized protein n=1 Tax=Phoxinus phoxinus TaxID=58324 RepID=A0AAN9CDU5_9TELE